MSKWVRIYKYPLIAGCFLAASLGSVETAPTWISKKDWEAFLSAKRCDRDALLLIDGTQICGRLDKLPTLSFSFASLNFIPSKVALLAVVETGQGLKMQIVTRDGQNYLASVGKGKFVFNVAEGEGLVKKEIDPKSIRLAILQERDTITSPSFKALSTITLRNGDQLPATLADEPIVLTDGWREMALQPNEIIELSFNGGVHGKILEGGLPTVLSFKFIQEPALSLTIPYSGEKVKLPWEMIETITTFNGGFKAGERQAGSVLNLLSNHIQNIYGSKPESFGNTKGKLLDGVIGALVVPPKDFEGLEQIGMETIGQPTPLFDPTEEQRWDLHIAFEAPAAPAMERFEQIAMLDPDQLQEIKEALVFDSIQKKDVDPPTFDVPDPLPLEDKPDPPKPTPLSLGKDPDLTDEELELLEGLIAHEAIPQKVLEAVHHPQSKSALSRKRMTYIAEGKLAVSHLQRAKRGVLIPTTGKPTLLVRVPSFYIDDRPVTNADYQIFILATNYPPPPHWGGTRVPEGLEDAPVVNICYKDAERYAAWIGRRLPTELEWASAIKSKMVKPTQLKEWSATNSTANSKLVLCSDAFVTRNENWLDHTTSFRTVAD